MLHCQLSVSENQKKIILEWHNLATVESLHRGDGAVTFPDESVILKILAGPGPYQFNQMQIKTIAAWADKVFNKHYGGGDIRNYEEEKVYKSITAALNKFSHG